MNTRFIERWSRCLLLLSAVGCGGKLTVYEVLVSGGNEAVLATGGATLSVAGSMGFAGGGAVSSGGTFAEGGAPSNAGGVVSTSEGGVAGAEGGASGVAGALSLAGAAGSGGLSSGVAGAGGGAGGGAAGLGGGGAASGAGGQISCAGTMYLEDVPADCHATTCGGSGSVTRVVDQNNTPTPANSCLEGTCNDLGNPGTEPTPAGTRCAAAAGQMLCDGAGNCVACLHSSDCPSGLSCAAWHVCVGASCSDTDCGGVCPSCANGKKCFNNADCASYSCDAVSRTCIANQCLDHHQDGLESDADCGGDVCSPCALGQGCFVDSDCVSKACDQKTLLCVIDGCTDHRQDGQESDVDCGGPDCQSCQVGQGCKSNFDCLGGHFCAISPHVCQ